MMTKLTVFPAIAVPWLAIGAFLWLMAGAGGGTFSVNSTADAVDALPGDGICETAAGSGICTLRAAVQESNALSGLDTIMIPAGTYTLSIPGGGEDASATGDLDIVGEVVISGAGQDNTIVNGGGLDRVFHIRTNFEGTVSLSGLTLQNGSADSGGGVYIVQSRVVISDSRFSSNTADDAGGGILLDSSIVTMTETTVDHNMVTSANGDGGGISVMGSVIHVENSAVFSNSIPFSDSSGGGFYIFGWSTIINTTLSGNQATNGGAILFGIGEHSFVNNTIANNIGTLGGGIYDDPLYSGSAVLTNTIVAENGFSNCHDNGEIISQGNNLESGVDCNFNAPGDLNNSNPLLGKLQDNGGQSWTMALMNGSPAIDAANEASCPATDQRGVGRPLDGDGDGTAVCDIGAYEASSDIVYSLYLPVMLK